uniref:Uncharacterized protein n=1 Tax=Anguilla anguilla TaxID=7936 RepID=A0A0E9T1V9_ANGAN
MLANQVLSVTRLSLVPLSINRIKSQNIYTRWMDRAAFTLKPLLGRGLVRRIRYALRCPK